MEHKTWLWRRKPSEKTISVNGRTDPSSVEIEHEKEKALELERSLEELNNQLLFARAETNAKEDLLGKQAKAAIEAMAGWKKAEEEAATFKKELDDALNQKITAEERVVNAEKTLAECLQQLNVVKEEQKHIMDDVIAKLLKEEERTRVLEELLAETNTRLSEFAVKNNNLSTVLEIKEKLIEDLAEYKFRSEEDITALVSKLETSEKCNIALKYEVCMLQKELNVRNEERDFNMKAADAARRQHHESVRKIAKLESECQKLRVMVRKRLPGPAALAKMRTEVDMLVTDANGINRRKPKCLVDDLLVRNFPSDTCYDSSCEHLASVLEKLHSIEEENKVLKESLAKKSSELQSSRVMFARIASKLSQAELQVEELSKGQACLELAKSSPIPYDLSLAPISEDCGDEDSVSCSESWASALISELEHFKNGKRPASMSRTSAASDLSLMDDFVEMEKLAMVCVDKPLESLRRTQTDSSPEIQGTGRELVPVHSLYDSSTNDDFAFAKHPSWLQDILRVIVQKQHAMKANLNFILEEIRDAFGEKEHVSPDHQPQSNLDKYVHRLLDLIDGIIKKFTTEFDGNVTPHHKSSSISRYVARVFLFESSDIGSALEHFAFVCKDLLNGKADLTLFLHELNSTMDWIMNHCFSLQDVSHMKDSMKEQCEMDETHIGNGFENGKKSPVSEVDRVSDGLYILSELKEMELKIEDENRRLKNEIVDLETRSKAAEQKLNATSSDYESVSSQLKRSEESLSILQMEVAKLNESKGSFEDHIIDQKLANDDLSSQLRVAKIELKEALQKLSSMEVELEEKSSCCEELEATCLELQLQLQSLSTREIAEYNISAEDKQLRTDLEISEASEKLAECQETILHLGKQLKALASPRDAVLFDKVISTQSASRTSRRPLLLDQMPVEDGVKLEELKTLQTKEIICTESQKSSITTTENSNAGLFYGHKILANIKADNSKTLADIIQQSPMKPANIKAEGGALAIMPKRQRGSFSLLRKLLTRRKRGGNKKVTRLAKS